MTTAGCQEESSVFRGYRVEVEVRDIQDDSPTAGIELILMNPDRNLPLSEPVLADHQGAANFDGLPAGRYAVLAYPRNGHGIEHQPEPFSLPGSGSASAVLDQAGPAGLQTAPSTAYQVIIKTFRSTVYDEGLPRISGEVVDAVTGEPLARTFIGLPAHVTAYQGALGVDDDVTGLAGQFTVSRIPFSINPETDNIFQVLPLIVTCEGYVPLAWFHHPAHGDENLDITGVRIELQPGVTVGTGRLSGRVTMLGEPAANVQVGLAPMRSYAKDRAGGGVIMVPSHSGQGDPAEGQPVLLPTGIGQPSQVVATDARGYFSFKEVPAGWYVVHPGFLPDDPFVLVVPGRTRLYQVAPSTVSVTDTFTVLTAIFPVSPLPGQAVTNTVTTLQWTAVEAADRYLVYVDGDYLGWVAGTEMQLDPEAAIGPGRHSWSVVAVDGSEQYMGLTEQQYRFTVLDR
jgi:hypothetical protein